jgi:alkyl hydroperoxide reductase subunit AhpF
MMIRSVSSGLKKPLSIVVYAERNHCVYCDRTLKLAALLQESGKIDINHVRFAPSEKIELLKLRRSPAIVILSGVADRVTFYGAPMGLELSTFLTVLEILSSRPVQSEGPAKHVEIFVSMVCSGCHFAVLDIIGSHRSLNLDVIATAQFPDLARERRINSVPAVFIDEQKVSAGNSAED